MSKIVFSRKFKILNDTIRSWDVLRKLKPKDKDYKYFKELSKVHTILMSGGRDSGKSYTKSIAEITAAVNHNHCVLSTRYTMSSTDMSINKALEERIELLNYDSFFNYKNNEYVCKHNEGRIDVTGQKTSSGDQTAKLKSLEGYSIFSTDEGEELPTFEDWNKVKRSLRRSDVQCLSIIAFNPPTTTHWIFPKFYINVPNGFNGIINGVLYVHTTYLDNGRENMAEHNWNEYEALRKSYEYYESLTPNEKELVETKIKRDADEYRYTILGSFKRKADNVVYEYWELGKFKEVGAVGFGLDFGSNDPDALTKVAVDFKTKTIYIKQEYFKSNTNSDQLYDVLVDRCGFDNLIVADTSGRRLIRQYWQKGVNIKRATKKDKKDQIKVLSSWRLVIDPDSKDLIDSFNNYKYHDKKAGVIEEGVNIGVGIKHYYSDLMDSWRYIAWDFIRKSIKK